MVTSGPNLVGCDVFADLADHAQRGVFQGLLGRVGWQPPLRVEVFCDGRNASHVVGERRASLPASGPAGSSWSKGLSTLIRSRSVGGDPPRVHTAAPGSAQ